MQQNISGKIHFIYKPSIKQWITIFLVWTLIAILFASQTYLELAYAENPSGQDRALAPNLQNLGFLLPTLLRWYVWCLLTPVIFKLANAFPLERPFLWQHLLRSIAFGLLITIVALFGMSLIQRWFGENTASIGINITFPPQFFTFWTILGVGHLLRYQHQSREQAVQTAQLEAKLAQAQLQVLRSQLNPHFLFNTLHAISAMMYRDAEAADHMVARLSELLRLSIEEIDGQFSTLQDELHFLRLYLALEQIRFQDRLSLSIMASPNVLQAKVPTMLLQPLVENAVRYGIAPLATSGEINISATKEGDNLLLGIDDSGPGLPIKFTEGVGLTSIRNRLRQLYPNNHHFNLQNRPRGGLSVQISFPFIVYKEDQYGN